MRLHHYLPPFYYKSELVLHFVIGTLNYSYYRIGIAHGTYYKLVIVPEPVQSRAREARGLRGARGLVVSPRSLWWSP